MLQSGTSEPTISGENQGQTPFTHIFLEEILSNFPQGVKHQRHMEMYNYVS
jgi:hypothetical protein